MEYAFKSERGYCPQCVVFGRVYFIQDRYIGGEKYEYALMSKPVEKKNAQKFPDVKRMVSFLFDKNITDDIAINLLLGQITVCKSDSYRMIEKDGVEYVWDESKKELRKHTNPKRETGYFSTYLECLNMAKEIWKRKEQESAGMQLSLFS